MADTLRDCGERALLEDIRRLVPARRRVVLGPGDDAAVMARSRHAALLTIDTLIEGVHFRRRWIPPYVLGRRAFEVSASDVAAMGGRPVAALLALAAPPATRRSDLRAMIRGVRAAAHAAGAALAGGNLAAARDLSLTIALLGDAPARPVARAGGRPGDLLFLTGTVGGAALGLRRLGRARSMPAGDGAVRRWQRPSARLRAGAELGRRRIAAAMIDVSDGLLIDAGRLGHASGTGVVLHWNRLPLAPGIAPLSDARARALALGGGEDYELLFAVRPARVAALARVRARLGCPITHVGELVAGRGVRVVDCDGRPLALPRRVGHEHFGSP
jgi:thiamine-monophosphate kinase